VLDPETRWRPVPGFSPRRTGWFVFTRRPGLDDHLAVSIDPEQINVGLAGVIRIEDDRLCGHAEIRAAEEDCARSEVDLDLLS
jgi:hypothetical protein